MTKLAAVWGTGAAVAVRAEGAVAKVRVTLVLSSHLTHGHAHHLRLATHYQPLITNLPATHHHLLNHLIPNLPPQDELDMASLMSPLRPEVPIVLTTCACTHKRGVAPEAVRRLKKLNRHAFRLMVEAMPPPRGLEAYPADPTCQVAISGRSDADAGDGHQFSFFGSPQGSVQGHEGWSVEQLKRANHPDEIRCEGFRNFTDSIKVQPNFYEIPRQI